MIHSGIYNCFFYHRFSSIVLKKMIMPFANFHLHTHFSDGDISPADLLREIYRTEALNYFAITDHDNLSAIEPVFRLHGRYGEKGAVRLKTFLPGIELSLREETLDLSVHLLGFFPHMTAQNHRAELEKLDQHLGSFCCYRCLQRGKTDMEARIRRAFEVNLENIREYYGVPDQVIGILNEKALMKNAARFRAAKKDGDVIQHPIPVTYQVIMDQWTSLLPHSSREKAELYLLRRNADRIDRLRTIYVKDGLSKTEAKIRAEKNQAILCQIKHHPVKEWTPLEGLDRLTRAGGVAVLAHPAVDHTRISYEDFDHHILRPMIANGLNGIEVYYPYALSYREEAIRRYGEIAEKNGLLISGGTDYHGDDRVGLDDIKLNIPDALHIIQYNRQ